MQENLAIVRALGRCFRHDQVSLYYEGEINDAYTHALIQLANYDLGTTPRKRMSYLMAESFQNIVRHHDQSLSNLRGSMFGVRGIHPYLHIFSTNLVNDEARDNLERKLNHINELSQEQMRDYYQEVLQNGEISEKGGAGLGLIEMARKSKNPLQVEFSEIRDGVHGFNMQIDLLIDKTIAPEDREAPMSIEENTELHQLVEAHDIIFIYHGNFSDEITKPMLNVLKGNTTANGQSHPPLHDAAMELMNNMARHAAERRGMQKGLFCMKKTKRGYFLSAGNYLHDDGTSFSAILDRINRLTPAQLESEYLQKKRGLPTSDGVPDGLGLIALRKQIHGQLHYAVREDKVGPYVIVGVEVLV